MMVKECTIIEMEKGNVKVFVEKKRKKKKNLTSVAGEGC